MKIVMWIFTSILTLGFLQGCGPAGSSGGGAAGLGINLQPQGRYIEEAKVDGYDASIFNIGCYPGSTSPKVQIDSRLKQGMIFQSFYQIAEMNQTSKNFTFENTIFSVSSTEIVKNLKLLNGSGINLSNGSSTKETCKLVGDKSECKRDPDLKIDWGPQCNYEFVDMPVFSRSKGRYIMSNGKNISATKSNYQGSGKAVCEGSETQGTLEFIQILSNEVPSGESFYFCGGSNLFGSMVFKLPNGTLYFGLTGELISF